MIDLPSLQAELAELDQRAARRNWLIDERRSVEQEQTQLRMDLQTTEQAALLLMEAGREARKKIKDALESIVTRALQAVYSPAYRFEVEVDEEGKEAQVFFYVCIGDEIREEPTDAMGGGVIDVTSLALRIAYHTLCGIGGPILLDEPGRHLDKEKPYRLGEILREIACEFGVQIVLVTHNDILTHSADAAYVFALNGITSEVKTL